MFFFSMILYNTISHETDAKNPENPNVKFSKLWYAPPNNKGVFALGVCARS